MPQRAWLRPTEFVEFRPDIHLAHERLADEKGRHTMGSEMRHRGVIFESAFAHHQVPRRYMLQ